MLKVGLNKYIYIYVKCKYHIPYIRCNYGNYSIHPSCMECFHSNLTLRQSLEDAMIEAKALKVDWDDWNEDDIDDRLIHDINSMKIVVRC